MDKKLTVSKLHNGFYKVLTGAGFSRPDCIIGTIQRISGSYSPVWELSYCFLNPLTRKSTTVRYIYTTKAACVQHMTTIMNRDDIVTFHTGELVNPKPAPAPAKQPNWNYVKKQRTQTELDYKRAWGNFRLLNKLTPNTAQYIHVEKELYTRTPLEIVFKAWDTHRQLNWNELVWHEIYDLTDEAKKMLAERRNAVQDLKEVFG